MQATVERGSASERIQSLIRAYGAETMYSEATVGKASEFAGRKELHLFIQGKMPQTVAISSLYLSGLSNREYRTRADLSDISGVSTSAIAAYIDGLHGLKKDVLKKIPFIVEETAKARRYRRESAERIKRMGGKPASYNVKEVDEVDIAVAHFGGLLRGIGLPEIANDKYEKKIKELSEWVNKLFFEEN